MTRTWYRFPSGKTEEGRAQKLAKGHHGKLWWSMGWTLCAIFWRRRRYSVRFTFPEVSGDTRVQTLKNQLRHLGGWRNLCRYYFALETLIYSDCLYTPVRGPSYTKMLDDSQSSKFLQFKMFNVTLCGYQLQAQTLNCGWTVGRCPISRVLTWTSHIILKRWYLRLALRR